MFDFILMLLGNMVTSPPVSVMIFRGKLKMRFLPNMIAGGEMDHSGETQFGIFVGRSNSARVKLTVTMRSIQLLDIFVISWTQF